MEQFSNQIVAVHRAIEALDKSGIAYAITGSWVIGAYGILRATHDLDVVVAIKAEDVPNLISAFASPPYSYDKDGLLEDVLTHTFFNLIDGESTLKIDFWPLQNDAYSQEQFRRRMLIDLGGRPAWMLAAEDIILAKLLWIKISDSERQWRDVESVWALKKDELDMNYLKTWAIRISVSNLLERVIR